MKAGKFSQTRFLVFVSVLIVGGYILLNNASGLAPVSPFAVMTYNIGSRSLKDPEIGLRELAKVIKSKGLPDLLLLQEVRDKKEAVQLAEILGFGHHIYLDYRGGKSGMAMMSRFTLSEPRVLYFNASQRGLACLASELIVEGKHLVACSVHLDRLEKVQIKDKLPKVGWKTALRLLITEMTEETVRSRSVDELLDWLGTRQSEEIIVGGDFNTVPFSKAIRKMGRVFDDALWPSFNFFSGSLKLVSLPVSPRIDFIFHSPGLNCREATVIKKTPGDHYPVWAMFDIDPQITQITRIR